MDMSDIFKDDQDNAAIKGFGRMLGMYYQGIVESGIPEDTAKQMVLDYHWLITCKSQFGDKRASFPPRS